MLNFLSQDRTLLGFQIHRNLLPSASPGPPAPPWGWGVGGQVRDCSPANPPASASRS